MPVLACNPILITLEGLTANAWVDATLYVSPILRTTANVPKPETLTLNLRTNAAGKVENFDISPLIAAYIRQTFDGDKERYNADNANGYYDGNNQYSYSLVYKERTVKQDAVLFGAGAVEPADLEPPYLLRRNTSAIHVYEGLPGSFAQVTTMFLSIYDLNLKLKKSLSMEFAKGHVILYYFKNLELGVGDYYMMASGKRISIPIIWDDSDKWNDNRIWNDYRYEIADDAVVYPLHVHPSPVDCIRAGAKIYVRYWNSRGAWSYALLDVQYNDLQAKTTYAGSWRVDATPVNGRIFGDRVQTDKEMTYSITAGRDGLDRLDVDELRDLQRSWCVQVWDVEKEAWRDCYVKDATTRNAAGRAQEMTFTIEMPHEYTFTR